jgi:hypothetical protein
MSYWNNGKFCHSTAEIPTGEHYAIIYGESVHIPGDERSRTHPGHGYPESSHSYLVYVAFEKKAEWEKQIEEMIGSVYGAHMDFKAFHVKPAKITQKFSVVVE